MRSVLVAVFLLALVAIFAPALLPPFGAYLTLARRAWPVLLALARDLRSLLGAP